MNTHLLTKSTHAMALPAPAPNSAGQSEAAPTSVHIMPAGTFSGRDGRGPYTLTDAQAVIAASLSRATLRGIPMDYDHQLEYVQQNGQPALASGWITGLEARADGLWADVEWTNKAAAHVAAREYRYLSPVFYHGSDGAVIRIESVALTNQPNFSLKAMASMQEAAPTTAPIKENSMLKSLATMLGLQAEASETAVQNAVRDLQEQHKALAAKAESPDPAKYIPIKVFEDVQKELASLKSVCTEAAAASLVSDALAGGKITPAMQDWAKSYASKDADGFKAWAALAPDLRPGGADKAGTDTTANAPNGTNQGLTEVEKAIAAACGISETDFAKEKGV